MSTLVKLTCSARPHPVEAELTDVGLPGYVNHGVGQEEAEAIANFKNKVAGYIHSLEQINYTVGRSCGLIN